jgi:hypothetical protein
MAMQRATAIYTATLSQLVYRAIEPLISEALFSTTALDAFVGRSLSLAK